LPAATGPALHGVVKYKQKSIVEQSKNCPPLKQKKITPGARDPNERNETDAYIYDHFQLLPAKEIDNQRV
jgi:hypothetical protein